MCTEPWAIGIEKIAEGGVRFLVLDGGFTENDEEFVLRMPDGVIAILKAGPQGAKVWIKAGHLRFIAKPL